jgi:hypothetical protein
MRLYSHVFNYQDLDLIEKYHYLIFFDIILISFKYEKIIFVFKEISAKIIFFLFFTNLELKSKNI